MIIESAVYSDGYQYPIVRPPGSPWVVVDALGASWDMDWPEGKAIALDIHLDRDDPDHVFLGPDEWAPFPNAKKLSAAYNRPFERNFRLRMRRAVIWESIAEIMKPHFEATDALALARAVRRSGTDAHIEGDLEYYPDGAVVRGPQVWRHGNFWFRVALENRE